MKTEARKATARKAKEEPEAQRPQVLTIPAGTALVRMEPQEIYSSQAPRPPATAEELAHAAGEQIKFYQLLIELIAKSVPLSDITLFGGRQDQDEPPQVWFSAMACRRILGWGKYNFKSYPVETHPYEDGSGVEFRIYGELSKGDWCVSIMGNRSTTDEFFSRAYRARCKPCDQVFSKFTKQCPQCKQETVEEAYTLPLKEIDRSAVVQAAISNAWNKALAAAGLMPSYEDLEKALKGANKDIERIRRVGFSGRRAQAEADDDNTKALRTKVFKLLATICDNDQKKMADTLERVTTFQGNKGTVKGKRDVLNLTAKQLPYALKDLEKLAKSAKPVTGKPATEKPQSQAQASEEKSTSGLVPKAVIPDMKIAGHVLEVEGPVTSRNGRVMVVVTMVQEGEQGSEKLYCFDNRTMQGQKGDTVKAFELLKGAAEQFCMFSYREEKGKQTGTTYKQITGIFQIGEQLWDDDGLPYVDRLADRDGKLF